MYGGSSSRATRRVGRPPYPVGAHERAHDRLAAAQRPRPAAGRRRGRGDPGDRGGGRVPALPAAPVAVQARPGGGVGAAAGRAAPLPVRLPAPAGGPGGRVPGSPYSPRVLLLPDRLLLG